MPYKTNADLPKGVLAVLADESARTIFRDAYNTSNNFKAAWRAVSDAGWQPNGEGVWALDPDQRTTNDIAINEAIALDADANVRMTSDGYLVAFPRVARTGIQLYTGDEVGRSDLSVVRVYRPESEIFSADSLKSYANKPVTNDHPNDLVTPETWHRNAIGNMGDEVLRDGQFVRVPMMVMDAGAIRDYESGKRQLSLGYTMDLKWGAGVTPDTQEEYDATQTKVRANHLALVRMARGGPQLRIGDYNQKQEIPMTTKQIVVDGLKVTMDERDADIVTRAIDNLTAAQAKLQKQFDEANAAIQLRDEQLSKQAKDIEAGAAKVVALEQQVKDAAITPDKLKDMVVELAGVTAQAKKLIGDKLTTDGKTVDDIRRQVVDAKVGAKAKDWTVAQVAAAFETFPVVADMQPRPQNPLDRTIGDGISNQLNAADAAYEKMCNDMENGWKSKPVN